MYESFDSFMEDLRTHLETCINNHIADSILIYVADRNVPQLIQGVNEYVAKIESWGPSDTTSYSSFEVARQQLFLKHNIFLEWFQSQHTHEGHNHIKLSSHGKNTIFYDLTRNSTDPLEK